MPHSPNHSPNTPILYRNVMDGLPSELACDAFLWAVDRQNEDAYCYRAEAFGRDVDDLSRTVDALLELQAWTIFRNGSRLMDSEQTADLKAFMLTRHANWRYGGNLKPAYVAGGM